MADTPTARTKRWLESRNYIAGVVEKWIGLGITRADGTTAAERFFGQKPRSMFAAILDTVDLPPAPLSPPRQV